MAILGTNFFGGMNGLPNSATYIATGLNAGITNNQASAVSIDERIPITFSAQTNLWGKLYIRSNSNSITPANTVLMEFKDGSGNVVVRIRGQTDETLEILTNESGVLTVRATSAVIPLPRWMDVHVDMTSGGGVDLNWDGVSVASWTGDVTDGGNYTSITKVIAGVNAANGFVTSSGFMVTDDDSRAYSLWELDINGAGPDTGFTGAYTDIDEPTEDYTDSIISATVTDKATFAHSGLDAGFASGYTVESVVVFAQCRNGVNLHKIRLIAEQAGDYANGTTETIHPGRNGIQYSFTTDPHTAAAWDYDGVNAMTFGVEHMAA